MFQLLRPELFPSPTALERLPKAGFVALSIAPVLITLMEQSSLTRTRCLAYLDAQTRLAERLLHEALTSGHAERDTVRQLSAFARTNARLRSQLKDD